MAKLIIGTETKEDSLVKETITTTIERKSAKAILVKQVTKFTSLDLAGHGNQLIANHLAGTIADDIDLNAQTQTTSEWLPKSQIKITGNKIEIPDWLANKKLLRYI